MKERKNKTAPAGAGKHAAKIMKYYEWVYAPRKLRRMHQNGASVKMLRDWADNFKTPSGISGNGALVRLGRELKINVAQV